MLHPTLIWNDNSADTLNNKNSFHIESIDVLKVIIERVYRVFDLIEKKGFCVIACNVIFSWTVWWSLGFFSQYQVFFFYSEILSWCEKFKERC